MKDFIKAKIAEARECGRDIPLVFEEMFMHLAGAIDGDKPDEQKQDDEKHDDEKHDDEKHDEPVALIEPPPEPVAEVTA